TLSLQIDDPRITAFHARLQVASSALTTPLRLSDAKVVAFDVNQNNLGENVEFTWRLRFFPAVGGPLRVVRGEDWVLVRNDVVGFFAEGAKVLGPDDAPAGLAIVLKNAPRK